MTTAPARPRFLAPNPIDHFYRGGDRIAALRGFTQAHEHQPEEWLGATVTRAGAEESGVGLARTTDGELLRDLVVADPGAWLGEHAEAAWRAGDTGVLVKLLDARQRLPVHVHPDRAFASSHLACPYGKTEAWIVLDAEPGSTLHVGWREPVDGAELARRRDAQDSSWMLERMHRIEARRGMGVLVPAGTVHAIGSGILVAEVQEPTDFSILLEWSVTTATREESHLGLGFDTAMAAVSLSALGSPRELIALTDLDAPTPGVTALLPPAAEPYFRAHRAGHGARVEAGFAIVLALEEGAIEGAGGALEVPRGGVVAVPEAFGSWRVAGADLIVHRPGAGWPATLGAPGVA
ncbi:class I mannose-6-phosphate isomerase [Microbacterium sp. Marseille-Q6965]|uniref:class I mannose-6-phosphate isomerase n=1 Tax=Microbacterium sp. Marseille-Q6965 TaxID=2965072 RepID=UPI0021B82F07|nr:class I mannose-6-phosphate isomerase [Microbacterium sp. Marseille-Q6965]